MHVTWHVTYVFLRELTKNLATMASLPPNHSPGARAEGVQAGDRSAPVIRDFSEIDRALDEWLRQRAIRVSERAAAKQCGLGQSGPILGMRGPTTPEAPVLVGGVAGDATRSYCRPGPCTTTVGDDGSQSGGPEAPAPSFEATTAVKQLDGPGSEAVSINPQPSMLAKAFDGRRDENADRGGTLAAMRESKRDERAQHSLTHAHQP